MARYTRSGPRMEKWITRRKEAKERQNYWEALTSVQQLDRLDEKLGRGVGAVKQRARIIKNSYKKSIPKVDETKQYTDPKKQRQQRKKAKAKRNAQKGYQNFSRGSY